MIKKKEGGNKMRSAFILCGIVMLCMQNVHAATPARNRGFNAQNMGAGGAIYRAHAARGRQAANTNDVTMVVSNDTSVTQTNTISPEITVEINNAPAQNTPDADTQEVKRLRDACMARRAGFNDTFVWAARNSDTSKYSLMVEDVDNPENNACFAKVFLENADSRVDTHDIPSRYVMMGAPAKCGDWVSGDNLKSRILDATKSKRVWGTVAATVASAGVGVGAMELFGNKLIGGALQGQKSEDLKPEELLLSQLKKLEKDNPLEHGRVMAAIKKLGETCERNDWNCAKPADCDPSNPFIQLYDDLYKKTDANSGGTK